MIKRMVSAAVIGAAILAGTTGCPNRDRVCEPGEVREDSYQPGRYWQCNQDGTKETPLNAPGTPDDSIEG